MAVEFLKIRYSIVTRQRKEHFKFSLDIYGLQVLPYHVLGAAWRNWKMYDDMMKA